MQRVWQLLVGLSLSLTCLAQDDAENFFVLAGEPGSVEGFAFPDRVLVGTEGSGDIVVLESELTAPIRTPVHVHHIHHEAVYVLSGRLRVTILDQAQELTAGDFVFMPKAIPHRLEVLEAGRSIVISSNGYDEARSRIFELLSQGVSMQQIYEDLEFLEYLSE